MNSQAIYEGQRAASPGQRVFMLTRNGFAGQQRYGAASWSGDISSTWSALRKTDPGGPRVLHLGHALTGPWTAAGSRFPPRFASAARGSAELDEWRELNARWFEYATFLPLLRVHGQAPRREMWSSAATAARPSRRKRSSIRLRYRLLPYVYSLAGAVTEEGGNHPTSAGHGLSGRPPGPRARRSVHVRPALMVKPGDLVPGAVASGDVCRRRPAAGTIFGPARRSPRGRGRWRRPSTRSALMLRAGSIIPIGPELAYTDEKPADSDHALRVRRRGGDVHPLRRRRQSANDHEHGAFARIPMRWSEGTHTLTIGRRVGRFAGMLTRRIFQVVLVRRAKAVPFSFVAPSPAATVTYVGDAVSVPLD